MMHDQQYFRFKESSYEQILMINRFQNLILIKRKKEKEENLKSSRMYYSLHKKLKKAHIFGFEQ